MTDKKDTTPKVAHSKPTDALDLHPRSREPFHSSAPPPVPVPASIPSPPDNPADFHARLHAVEVKLDALAGVIASINSVGVPAEVSSAAARKDTAEKLKAEDEAEDEREAAETARLAAEQKAADKAASVPIFPKDK